MGTIKIQAANISKTISQNYTSVAKTLVEEAEHVVKEATVNDLKVNAKKATHLRSETGIKHESYNPTEPEPVYEEVTELTLESTFALEQLQKAAKKDSLYKFRYHIKKNYGAYFTNKAVDQLYQNAKKATVTNPKIKVVRFISPPNASGAYNNSTQHILVSEKLIKQALTNNDKMGELLVVLVEEFGAHINWLLRNTYTQEADKPMLKPRKSINNDLGAKFAALVININFLDTQQQTFAKLTHTTTKYKNQQQTSSNTEEKELVWHYQQIHTKLNEYVNKQRQNTTDIAGNYNFYKAGRIDANHGKFGHLDIEEKALIEIISKAKYSKIYKELTPVQKEKITEIIHKIYFGNWLRDFSQVIDPGMISPMSDVVIEYSTTGPVNCQPATAPLTKEAQKKCEEAQLKHINDKREVKIPNNYQIINPNATINPFTWADPKIIYGNISLRPVTWSRETLTNLVQLLAVQEFMHTKEDGAVTKDNYFKLTDDFKKNYIDITPKVLGVYRPDEHIDNPKSAEDKSEAPYLNYNLENPNAPFKPTEDDMGFVGNPTQDEMSFNKKYGMKNYMRTNLNSKQFSTKRTAYEYVMHKINQACVPNANFDKIEPMMHFGAALHVMEDFFAHTNFVEIAAAKVSNNDRVFPWVDKVEHAGAMPFVYDTFALLNQAKGNAYLAKKSTPSVINATPEYKNAGFNDIARFIPLVTGTFGKLDMAASLMPILEKNFSIEIEDYSRIDSGERTFNDALTREILKGLDASQDIDGSGTKDNTYTEQFETLLWLRDWYADAKTYIPPWVREKFHTLMEYVGAVLNFSIYMLLRTFGGKIAEAQLILQEQVFEAEKGNISIGTDPSHTQIAKDDPRKPMHQLSAKLAIHVVQQIGGKMFKFWKGDSSVTKQDIINDIDTFFKHPAASSWQDNMVKEWCNANSALLCQASTPSVVIDSIITSIEEMNEFTENLIKVSKDDKRETTLLESVLETYDKNGELIKMYTKLLEDGNALLKRAKKLRENSNYNKYYRPYHCPKPQQKQQ